MDVRLERREVAYVWKWWLLYLGWTVIVTLALGSAIDDRTYSSADVALLAFFVVAGAVVSVVGVVQARMTRPYPPTGRLGRMALWVSGPLSCAVPVLFVAGFVEFLNSADAWKHSGFALVAGSLLTAPWLASFFGDDIYRRRRPVDDPVETTKMLLRLGIVYAPWYWFRYVLPDLRTQSSKASRQDAA